MNISEINTLTDPVIFAKWVHNVADVNERFAEAVHDTADIVATIDPTVAYKLYQAADTANHTVYTLRTSVPLPPSKPVSNLRAWVAFGAICMLCGHLLSQF